MPEEVEDRYDFANGAANQQIEKLELSNRDGQRLINELNGKLADGERAKEAAERKLATARTLVLDAKAQVEQNIGKQYRNRSLMWLRLARILAQIEQPQSTEAIDAYERS